MASPEKASPGGQVRPPGAGTSDARRVALPAPYRVRRSRPKPRPRIPQCTRNPRTARRLLAVALEEVLKRGLLGPEQVAEPTDEGRDS